jgi:hypothetical protein
MFLVFRDEAEFNRAKIQFDWEGYHTSRTPSGVYYTVHIQPEPPIKETAMRIALQWGCRVFFTVDQVIEHLGF